MRDLTSHHVDLIAVGDRNDHVGIVGARLRHDVGMAGHTPDRPDVKSILEFPQSVSVLVDDRDVAGFFGEILGEVTADLTSTQDDDFNGVLVLAMSEK